MSRFLGGTATKTRVCMCAQKAQAEVAKVPAGVAL